MKTISMSLFSMLILIQFLTSCRTPIMGIRESESWLESKVAAGPRVIISGTWRDAIDNPILIIDQEEDQTTVSTHEMGWGKGFIDQKGNQVTGSLGGYQLSGTVSGEELHLVFHHSSRVYYLARLTVSGNKLVGFYYTNKDLQNGYQMVLAGGEIVRR